MQFCSGLLHDTKLYLSFFTYRLFSNYGNNMKRYVKYNRGYAAVFFLAQGKRLSDSLNAATDISGKLSHASYAYVRVTLCTLASRTLEAPQSSTRAWCGHASSSPPPFPHHKVYLRTLYDTCTYLVRRS